MQTVSGQPLQQNRTANVNGNSDLTVSSAGNIAGVAEKIKIAPNLCEMRYLAE
jgi:hypothetical protein